MKDFHCISLAHVTQNEFGNGFLSSLLNGEPFLLTNNLVIQEPQLFNLLIQEPQVDSGTMQQRIKLVPRRLMTLRRHVPSSVTHNLGYARQEKELERVRKRFLFQHTPINLACDRHPKHAKMKGSIGVGAKH